MFVHLDAAEHDGAVARIDLGCEHGRVEARGDKANAREDNTRGNEPARHSEVDLLRAGHGTHSFLRCEMRGSAALLALTLPERRGGLPRPERREARDPLGCLPGARAHEEGHADESEPAAQHHDHVGHVAATSASDAAPTAPRVAAMTHTQSASTQIHT